MITNIKQYITPRNFFYISTATAIIGLFTTQHARALPNSGFAGMVIASFFYLRNWKNLFTSKNLGFQSIFVIFFIYAISGLQTDVGNSHQFWKILQMKTAFLVVPFAFCLFPALSKKELIAFLWIFLITATLTALGSVVTYILNFSEMNEVYLDSKAIPVAGNHVRYSLMIVSAILAGAYIFLSDISFFNPKREKTISGILTIFLVLFLHLLSVRSGLLAFYGIAGVFILYSIFNNQLKRFRIPSLIAIIALPALVVLTPTGRNKIKNTLHDLTHIENPYSANYESITARIFSYKVAAELFDHNKWSGVGIGNLKEKTDVVYIKNYAFIKPENRLIPHNQLLFNLVAFGVVGSGAYLILFFIPLFFKKNYKRNLFLTGQYIVLLSSFMFEATLETHLGLIFSLFFIMLPLSTLKEETDAAQ